MGAYFQLVLYVSLCSLLFGFAAFMVRRHRATTALRRVVRLATGLPTYRSSLPRLNQELDRARRYVHPLTLVVLSHYADPLREPEAALARLFAFSLVGSMVRDAFRATDILAFDSTMSHYLLLMPESPKWQVGQAVQRMQDLAWSRAGVRLHVGLAEFPTDALTIEALVSACRAAIDARISPTASTAPADDGQWVAAR